MAVDPNASNLNGYDVRAYRIGRLAIVSGYINSKVNGGGLNLITVLGVAPLGGMWRASASDYTGGGSKCYATAGGGGTVISFDLAQAGADYNFLVAFVCA